MSNFSFSQAPVIKHSRSRFDLSHPVKTSANVGDLVPFDVQEVYAGDTFKVRTACVSRLASQFLKPVMDNLFLDVYYFFVPSRILYDKFKNIFGENTESAWANTIEYEVPTVPAGTQVPEKSVGDYLGLPTFAPLSEDVNVLPFRAFAKIYEDWFRDQNNISPMHIQTGEIAQSESFNNQPWAPNNYFGRLPKVAKMHDYFTSCLPAPQKGNAVDLPLVGNAPVTGDVIIPPTTLNTRSNIAKFSDERPLVFGASSLLDTNAQYALNMVNTYGQAAPSGEVSVNVSEPGSPAGSFIIGTNLETNGTLATTNLQADLSGVSAATVNDLRFAFQYQKMLERDARSGTRYVEYLLSHFGVSAGDYRLQRSEFLGGRRTPISIHQVTQTTGAGSASSPLADVGAYSLSNGISRYTKGFTENGYVIGVFCIRQFHTYQQGIEKFWTRKKRTDFYDPVFSHIGEQPVYKTELFASAEKGVPFGYSEAWADLRTRPARVTAQMRSNSADSYDFWHFADVYENAPVLSEAFINETPQFVDRAITVSSSVSDQFLLDFYINNIAYRVMPTYSIPSLIDHD